MELKLLAVMWEAQNFTLFNAKLFEQVWPNLKSGGDFHIVKCSAISKENETIDDRPGFSKYKAQKNIHTYPF